MSVPAAPVGPQPTQLARDGVMANPTASNSASYYSGASGSPHDNTPPFGTSPRPPSRVIWPWPMFLIGVAAVLAVWYVRPLLKPTPANRVQRDLTELRKLVDRGPVDTDRALSLGQRILENADRFPQFVGEAQFLLGCVHLRKASEMPAEADGDELRAAIAAFEKA